MKTTVSFFHRQVASDYGPEVASEFARQFPTPSVELSFREAMETLDRILLGPAKPAFPKFGPTTSLPQEGDLEFGD